MDVKKPAATAAALAVLLGSLEILQELEPAYESLKTLFGINQTHDVRFRPDRPYWDGARIAGRHDRPQHQRLSSRITFSRTCDASSGCSNTSLLLREPHPLE